MIEQEEFGINNLIRDNMYCNKKVIAINFANSKFEHQRKYNTQTAYKKGKVDQVIEFYPKDIDEQFYKKNINIFINERGAGFWLWKPYLILKALDTMNMGEYLFYCDSGAYYVSSINNLIEVMEEAKMSLMVFELPLLSRQWTKKETFTLMDYDDYSQNQICAGYILIKKSDFAIEVIKKWLYYMQNEKILSPRKFTTELDFEDFIEHREDQSVFSIVCRKYDIIPFRDPSQFGDRPWEYAWMKSYDGRWRKWMLNIKHYHNSTYPKIVVSNRSVDPIKYKKKERLKSFLWKIGIYNKYYLKIRFGAYL